MQQLKFVKLHLWYSNRLHGPHGLEVFVQPSMIATMQLVRNQSVITDEEHYRRPVKDRPTENYTSIGFNFGSDGVQGGIEVIETPEQIMRIIDALELT